MRLRETSLLSNFRIRRDKDELHFWELANNGLAVCKELGDGVAGEFARGIGCEVRGEAVQEVRAAEISGVHTVEELPTEGGEV